jgi:DNA-binding MarR family transcriptional regulator
MELKTDTDRELILLEQIEHDPDVTQATLAAQLGVAVGTVNWLLRRMIDKGYVKIKRAQRKKLRYIITPEGISHRAQLTMSYIESSMRLYRRTRQHTHDLLVEVKAAGYNSVKIQGDGDIADIIRLSCLEQGVTVAEPTAVIPFMPTLVVQGTKVHLDMHHLA